jgi:intein/homing endonuclease
MNKQLSSLIGLLLSDGSVYYDKSKRSYCIQLTSKFKSMRNYFKFLMKKLFKVSNFHENRCKNAISIRIFSTKIAKFLFQFSRSYRTLHFNINPVSYPLCKVPNEIKKSKIFSAAFLKSYASCDGCIYFNSKYSIRYVEITCYHPRLLKDITECLKILDINCRTTENSVIISGKENLIKFYKQVGFLKESFISKTTSKDFGMSKMKKLEIALSLKTSHISPQPSGLPIGVPQTGLVIRLQKGSVTLSPIY